MSNLFMTNLAMWGRCLLGNSKCFFKEYSYSCFFFNFVCSNRLNNPTGPSWWNICQADRWSGREFRWRSCLGETAIRKAKKIRLVTLGRLRLFNVVTFFDDMDLFDGFCNKKTQWLEILKEMWLILYMFGDVFIVSCLCFFGGDRNSHKSRIEIRRNPI